MKSPPCELEQLETSARHFLNLGIAFVPIPYFDGETKAILLQQADDILTALADSIHPPSDESYEK